MNKLIRNLAFGLILLTVNFGCDRKPIGTECLCDVTALLPVDIDWSNLSEDPNNVRILVYNQSDGELVTKFVYEQNSNDIQAYLPLGIGEYKVIIVNEKRGDLENIAIEDEYDFTTTAFYVSEATYALDDPWDGDQVYLDELDELAVHVVENIEVTEDMVISATGSSVASASIARADASVAEYVSEKLIGIKPLRKDVAMEITIQVENVEGAILPVLVDLANVADGYIASTDKNTTSAASMQFYMDNRYSDDDDLTNGITNLTSEITMFGTLGERMSLSSYTELGKSLEFILRFDMIDGTVETKVMQVSEITVDDSSMSGVIRLNLMLAVTGENALPEDVQPNTDPDGGSGLYPWEDGDEEQLGFK
ncbi:MAG: DUF5119 domain-containing protein [Rikenellaceae bacterium]